MAQIKIDDLPILEELSQDEMASLKGGYRRGPANQEPEPPTDDQNSGENLPQLPSPTQPGSKVGTGSKSR